MIPVLNESAGENDCPVCRRNDQRQSLTMELFSGREDWYHLEGDAVSKTKKPPKYEIIKSYIIEGIKSRNFIDAIPSENQLAEKFGVSRMTARRALDEMERSGSVKRIPGRGTFINKAQHYTRGFFRVRPFRKWAEDLNAVLTTQVLECRVIDENPADMVEKLRYQGQLIRLRILNLLDGKPVRYAVQYLRADQCAAVMWANLGEQSVYDILINKCNLPLTRISQSMTAVGLPKELTRMFALPTGSPIFFFQRLIFSFENPVGYVEYFMRGDMAFEDTFAPQLDHSDFTT